MTWLLRASSCSLSHAHSQGEYHQIQIKAIRRKEIGCAAQKVTPCISLQHPRLQRLQRSCSATVSLSPAVVKGPHLASPPTPTKTRATLAATPPFRTSCTFLRTHCIWTKSKMMGSSGGSACRLLIDEGEGRGEWFRAVTRAGGACVPLPGPRSTYVLSQGAKPWRTRHPFRIGVLLGTSPRLFIIKLLCFRHNE